MGAWASLTLSSNTLDGIAPSDLQDPDFGTFDTTLVTDNRVDQAKGYIQMRLMRQAPDMMESADGPEEYLDAAVDIGKAHVNDVLQRMLGYCFLFHWYEQEALSPGDIMIDRGRIMKDRFEEAFDAFVGFIRYDEDFIDQAETTTDEGLHKFGNTVFVA